jgi:hypothetical protein
MKRACALLLGLVLAIFLASCTGYTTAPSSQSGDGASPSNSKLGITTTSLPSGAVAVPYSATLSAANGVAPYTWTVASGEVPPSLSLQSQGQISGTPSEAGTFSFAVEVKDSSGSTANANLSINIATASTPVVTSISPSSGPTSGGTTVTISGTNFAPGAQVTFGGTAATSVTVSNSSQIQTVTPSHIAGTVGVIVEVNGQSSTSSVSFTYNLLTPTVSSVSPSSGPTAGGTNVTISGTNFLAGALALFGTVPATNVNVVSATQIQAVTPANAAGPVTVTVQDPGNVSGALSGGFTYNASASGPPTISSVSPTSGPPGTQVTITGTNFESAATVSFGTTNASSTTFVSATQLLAAVPSISAGTYNLTVTTDPDPVSVTLDNGFTVTAPPPAQSLLSGCTVNASNQPNCSIPSGWTQVFADGFEAGTLPNTYNYGATVCGPAPSIQTAGKTTSTGTTVQAHTGTHSWGNLMCGDSSSTALGIQPSYLGAFHDIYWSAWFYVDPGAHIETGNWETAMLFVKSPATGVLFMNLDNFGGGVVPGTAYSTTTPTLDINMTTPIAEGCGSLTGYYPNNVSSPLPGSYPCARWTLPQGTWQQHEGWFHPNTVTNGTANADGFFRYYINGQLVLSMSNAILNGYTAMSETGNVTMEISGNNTVVIDSSAAACASVAGKYIAPYTKAPASCIAQNNWNAYIDDIIVMRQ